MVAGDAASEVDGTSSVIRASPHNEHDAGSVETDNNLQRFGETEPNVNSYDSGEARLSIADSSGQNLAPVTVSASLPNRDEDGPVMVNISNFTPTKILDKRSSPYGVEYRCELEPLWLPADLVKGVQMGCVHVRSYEKGLIRAARLDTLRKGTQKRKHSQKIKSRLMIGPLANQHEMQRP